MSVNKAIIVGNVTKDPEIRSASNGQEIATFSIATNQKWKGKDGSPQERVEWHRVVVFSQGLVGIVKNYVKKGSKLYIEGQLQTRKWTDKNGVDKYTTEIVLQNFNSTLQILNRVDDDSSSVSYDASQNNNNTSDSSINNDSSTKVVIDDEISF